MSPQTDFHGVAVITGAASGVLCCLQTTFASAMHMN
jgi:hypothetical protein